MKNLLWLIWTLLLLVAVVTGCNRAPRYDSRLVAADSLMRDNPDSALAIVSAVNIDSLTDEGDHAYRDLLLTQARYKCYIVATTDSDINRALNYYRRHDNEREKLTRAYIYKGTVMEELGHPDSAMLYYKHAETTAATDDYFNLGYCNMRIAQLYQSYYFNDSAVVDRMRQASRYYKAIGDTSYLITTIGTQGLFPLIVGKDSALALLKKSIDLGEKINSSKRFLYQSKLAGEYYYNKDFRQAIDLSLNLLKYGAEECNENQFYYYAARSYIELGKIDSALLIVAMIPRPASILDTMNYHLLMADLSQANHKYKDYAYHQQIAIDIQKSIYSESKSSKLTEAELNWDVKHQVETVEHKANSHVLYTIILIIVATISVLVMVIKLMKRYYVEKYQTLNRSIYLYQRELDQSKHEIERMISNAEQAMKELESERDDALYNLSQKHFELTEITKRNHILENERQDLHEKVTDIIHYRNEALKDLYNDIRIKKEQGGITISTNLIGMIKDLNERKKVLKFLPKESFWQKIKRSVDSEYNGFATFIEQKYPSLTQKELHLLWLAAARMPIQILKICMNYTNDVTFSKNKKRILKEKIGLDVKFEDIINMYLRGELK